MCFYLHNFATNVIHPRTAPRLHKNSSRFYLLLVYFLPWKLFDLFQLFWSFHLWVILDFGRGELTGSAIFQSQIRGKNWETNSLFIWVPLFDCFQKRCQLLKAVIEQPHKECRTQMATILKGLCSKQLSFLIHNLDGKGWGWKNQTCLKFDLIILIIGILRNGGTARKKKTCHIRRLSTLQEIKPPDLRSASSLRWPSEGWKYEWHECVVKMDDVLESLVIVEIELEKKTWCGVQL